MEASARKAPQNNSEGPQSGRMSEEAGCDPLQLLAGTSLSASAAPAHGSPVKQRALARVRGLWRQREQLYSPQHDKIKRWQEEHDPARKKVKLTEEEKQAKKAANATRLWEMLSMTLVHLYLRVLLVMVVGTLVL